MPLHIITWVVVSALAGFAVGRFWDELKVWASQVLNVILNGINTAIEVCSDAVVFLLKQGTNNFVKRVVVYVQNALTKEQRVVYQDQPISITQIPDKFNAQLQDRSELKVMEIGTRS